MEMYNEVLDAIKSAAKETIEALKAISMPGQDKIEQI